MVWKLIPPREGGHECEELNNRMDSTTVLKEMGTKENHVDTEKRRNYFPALKETTDKEGLRIFLDIRVQYFLSDKSKRCSTSGLSQFEGTISVLSRSDYRTLQAARSFQKHIKTMS
jgi:hypothetical protein